MRILHILNHTLRLSGNVHAAIDVSCAQSNNGHDVAMCSGGGNFDQILKNNKVTLIEIDQKRKVFTLIKASWKLYKFCKTWKPQLIHAHMMTSGVLAWPVTRILKIPLVTTVHNEFEKSSILMGLGDRVIAVSRVVKASMIKRGISEKRLRIVLNGTVGSARLPIPAPDPKQLKHPAIVFVGGLHPRKGVPDLMNAFRQIYEKHTEANLYIVGEGPYSKEYAKLSQDLNIADRVHFIGALNDPRSYLRAADIFVLASYSDPAPLVLSEAREAGCAIIATEVDGIPQLLDNGEAGILVPPARPDKIAEALSSLIESPEKLEKYKQLSLSNLENLSVNRVAIETVSIYQECISI